MNRNRNQHQRYSEIARKFLRSPARDIVAAVIANIVPTSPDTLTAISVKHLSRRAER